MEKRCEKWFKNNDMENINMKEIALHLIIVFVKMVIHMKIVNIQFVLVLYQMKPMFAMEMVIVSILKFVNAIQIIMEMIALQNVLIFFLRFFSL
jgi:hypothetical protein